MLLLLLLYVSGVITRFCSELCLTDDQVSKHFSDSTSWSLLKASSHLLIVPVSILHVAFHFSPRHACYEVVMLHDVGCGTIHGHVMVESLATLSVHG